MADPLPEKRLDPAVDLYRLLVDAVEDYAIFLLDPNGFIRSWNPGAQRLKGYTADEIIGRHFSIFYPEAAIRAHKPEIELEGATTQGRFEDEGWRLRKDGSRFWANVVLTAIRDGRGHLLGFAKITRDLTARRDAEEQARRLAAEQAAHAATESKNRELLQLTQQLEQQAVELELQTHEAQALAEELEQTNEELQNALGDAEESRASAEAADRYTRGILESISDPFIVQDADWRLTYINAKAEKAFAAAGRADSRGLIGQPLFEAFPELRGTTFEIELRRAAAEREPRSFEAYYAPRSEWAAVFCYPLPDGGLAAQWKDITGRKRAEEAARYLSKATDVLSSSLEYETTLGELARVVVPELADWCAVDIVGEDGTPRQLAVAHVNPDKVKWARELSDRYPPDPDGPTGVPNVLRTGKPELYPEIPQQMLESAAVDTEHMRLIRQLGLRSAMVVPLIARGHTLGALSLVSAESGRRYTEADLELAMELARRAALAVDNARLHRAETEAKRLAEGANEAKTQFLAVMSHELRTPLNAIAGYAELLTMGLRGPLNDGQAEYIERIQRSQRHLLSLINDVLNYAKLESGHVTYEVTQVAMHAALSEIESLVMPQMTAKGIALNYTPCGPDLTVHVDPDKLRQILLNLMSNAIKFTSPRGAISIWCEAGGDKVSVRVRDTGVGIPTEKLGTIFEPFIQLGRHLASAVEGTGLGLSISRDLARGMGGDLSVESTLGVGSTFTLTLPRRA